VHRVAAGRDPVGEMGADQPLGIGRVDVSERGGGEAAEFVADRGTREWFARFAHQALEFADRWAVTVGMELAQPAGTRRLRFRIWLPGPGHGSR
jgi:hypothetical protein